MNVFADRVEAMADELVERYGKSMTLRQTNGSTYDPATGQVSETIEQIEVFGVIEDARSDRADGLVRSGERLVTMAAAALSIAPVPGDQLEIDGKVYEVFAVATDYASDTAVVYKLSISL